MSAPLDGGGGTIVPKDWRGDSVGVNAAAPVRVLIVDDQKTFRNAARRVIESMEGFVVAGETDSGESAVSLVPNVRPDLVLMDVNLPGIDGIEATRLILARSSRVVVVLLSTREQATYVGRTAECGAAAYVYKGDFGPHSVAALWSAIRSD